MHEFGKDNFFGKDLFVYIIKNDKTIENKKPIKFLIIYEFSKSNDMPVLHMQTPEIASSVDRESWDSARRGQFIFTINHYCYYRLRDARYALRRQ